ncbi:MAG TPA: hypothetical protein VGN73_06265 [Gemmatimonadaceae bacterium]|nr:hypothetical protein [Gemmatimonadaceae bacterium]
MVHHSHKMLSVPYLLLAVAVATIALPSASRAQAASIASVSLSPELEAARTALAKYSDPIVAVRDGYLSTLACVDFPEAVTDGPVSYPPGAMGVHFLNAANIGPKLDPTKPQILIYEPVGDKLVLAGAEWFVPAQVAGSTPPTIFGHALAGPMDGHEPIIPASLRHYDLHVWFWKDNPKGMFTSTNAAVKCTSGSPYTVAMGAHHH